MKIRKMKLKSLIDKLKYESLFESSDYESKQLTTADVQRPGMQLMGYYNEDLDTGRVLLIGAAENEYLQKFPLEVRKEKYDLLLSCGYPAVIICRGLDIFGDIEESARKYNVSVFRTDHQTGFAMSEIIRVMYLNMAPRITRHGVLVEVYGLGLFITGDSGIGKSETAIELVKRGHRIIADDAVEIQAVDYNQLQGTAPELIRHYVELRGIGIIDVRQIFGYASVKPRQNIHLVVNLEPWKEGLVYDRFGMNQQYTNILGIDVPVVNIPVRPGRNLAVILEVAAMNQRQKNMGVNAAFEFTQQLNKHFEEHQGDTDDDE